LRVRNDSIVSLGSGGIDSSVTSGQVILKLNSDFQYWTIQNRNSGGLEFFNANNSTSSLFRIGESLSPASGSLFGTEVFRNFAPISGTSTFAASLIIPTINQTGGANGITRGLYVNPTLTAAADWRSIEWSNNSGWGLYGAGTANNYLGGNLRVGDTTDYNVRMSVVGSGAVPSTGTGASNIVMLLRDTTAGGINRCRYCFCG
jgi:hypothetical protein